MLLIETKALDKLKQESNFVKKFLESGPISRAVFDEFEKKFAKRMDVCGRGSDKPRQYFKKTTIEAVRSAQGVYKVAFVFLHKEVNPGERALSVAIVGLARNGSYIFNKIFESVDTMGNEQSIKKSLLEKGIKAYAKRMKDDKLDYYPCRDQGVSHDNGLIGNWLRTVGNDVEVCCGVDVTELQNVMLLDHAHEASGNTQDDEYAYDKGTGCCA